MKVVSFRLLILFIMPIILLFSRNQEDNKLLFNKVLDVYPEIEEILPQSDFHNSISTFVPSISAMRPMGIQSIPQNPLSSKDLARLKEMNIYNSLRLLEADTLPLIFEMLTKAIADRDNFETGFWSACLSNNIASYSDMNNIAEIIYLSEYIPSLAPDLLDADGNPISMRGSATASLSDAFRHDLANNAYEKLISEIKFQKIINTNTSTEVT